MKAERLYRDAINNAKKQAKNNSNASYRLNSDVITDTTNPDYYTYDNLTKLPDLEIKNYNQSKFINIDKNNINSLFEVSRKNAIDNGCDNYSDKSYEVINKYSGDKIYMNKASLKHAIYGSNNDLITTAIENMYDILSNAVLVNKNFETSNKNNNYSVYFNEINIANDSNDYLVRIITEDNEVKNFSVVYATNAKKRSATQLGSTTIAGRLHRGNTSSILSIDDLLQDVNNESDYRKELSKNVQLKLNNSENLRADKYTNKYSLGTNLNRMNENAELKERVAGWYGLEKRTVKKIIDLEQDTYKGTDLNNLVQEAAKEALRTGKVSDTTRNYILKELEKNNYFTEDLYDGDYQRLMDCIVENHDIVIENRYKQDVKELLARNGAKGNYYDGLITKP